MSRLLAALTLLGALSATSCITGSDTTLTAARSTYPISLSRSIVDAQGRIYRPGEDEIVGHFRRSWSRWEMFYGLVPLNRNADLARIVGAEIERRHGDAVVNLRVRASFSKSWYLTSVFLIFPQSVGVTVEGDVVHRKADAP